MMETLPSCGYPSKLSFVKTYRHGDSDHRQGRHERNERTFVLVELGVTKNRRDDRPLENIFLFYRVCHSGYFGISTILSPTVLLYPVHQYTLRTDSQGR